jgi:17beta-estradiol 17-dehydrogenase / very-long-chain 3-oxoacyl-CoA reductase
MNLLFCFSPLSKPFKISLGSLKGNLLLKQGDRQGDEKDRKAPATNNSSSWAIITGPTNGIGKEFAIELSKAGFNLFLIGRNLSKLTSLQDELMTKVNPKIEVEIETIDLSDNSPRDRGEEKDSGTVPIQEQTQSKEWKKILEKLKQISSRSNISILINNAGLSHSEPIEFQMNDLDQDINSLLNVNVFSVLYLTKLVLPFMLPYKKGLILNVGSFSALIPTPLLSTYAGSKGFLYTWSQALGTELEPRGIDVKLLNTYFVVSIIHSQNQCFFFSNRKTDILIRNKNIHRPQKCRRSRKPVS